MTIQELNDKYSFNWRKVAKDADTAYLTALNYFHGKHTNLNTTRAIVNALPITADERQALIMSMFERKGN